MSGPSPATLLHAIRTGSWLVREALTDARGLRRYAATLYVIAIALSLASVAAHAARRHLPYPSLTTPLEISGSQYTPVGWADIPGWSEDDQLQAYKAFRISCKPISAQQQPPADPKALGISLRDPCRAAKALDISDGAKARAFFEQHFLPLRISRLGEGEGFVTGYYEPVIDGSRTQTDLLFTQIQGSARVRLEDGSTVRINYDAHNGYPYTAVGRILIERNIIPKDQMSMQRIREWMDQNPDGANELRRQNRSYVFFREVQLSDKDEAVGAQGVPLTPGRSIAVDKSLHVYGTPFFIEGE